MKSHFFPALRIPAAPVVRAVGVVVCLVLGPLTAEAVPGDLDLSFGTEGTAVTVLGSWNPYIRSLTIQPDGKSLAVAADSNNSLVLVRHQINGTPDPTFNGSGKLVADFAVFVAGAAALQADGKILAMGGTVLARYNANGSLDTTFNSTGKVTTRCVNDSYPETIAYFGPRIAVQTDGKILVAGQRPGLLEHYDPDLYVARYDTGGALDPTFGLGGEVQFNVAEQVPGWGSSDYPTAVLVQNDGKIVLVGFSWGVSGPATEIVLVRCLADGTLDSSFGAGGMVITDITPDDRTAAASLQPDGKILLGVSLAGRAGVLRYHSDGTRDSGFGSGGVVELRGGSIGYPDRADSLAVQGNGKIVVGLSAPCSVVRLNPGGELDTSFNGTGVKPTVLECEHEGSVALQRDGRIIEARGVYRPPNYYQFDLGLARYEGDLGMALAVVSGTEGTPVAGEPAGTYLSSIGLPAFNDTGAIAFKGTIKLGRVATPAVLAGVTPAVVARKGDVAPDTLGANFASFKDPALNQAGAVAFAAKLAGAGVVADNDWGLWSDAFGSGLELMVREGDAVAGGGGWYASFTNIALDTGAGTPWVTFVAKLAGPDVSTANDCGLFSYNAGAGALLLLREGATLNLDGTPRVLRRFSVLGKTAMASGQGFALCEGAMTALLSFADGKTAVATVFADGSAPVAVAIKDGEAPGYDPGAIFGSFAGPGQNSLGHAVFRAGTRGTVSKDANAAIYATAGGGGLLERVAVKGENAPGVAGTTFTSFAVAVANRQEMVAFKGKVVGPGITDDNNTGLWLWEEDTTGLLCREDDEAAGTPTGTRWDKFTELALPDGLHPVFLARLLTGSGTPAVTTADDLGLWAVAVDGTTHLLVREGVTLVGGKRVKSFRALCAPCGSQGQTRSHNGVGGIVYWAQFTDGTHGIVTVQLP